MKDVKDAMHARFWRRHLTVLILVALGALATVIVLGQLLDAGGAQRRWLSEIPASIA